MGQHHTREDLKSHKEVNNEREVKKTVDIDGHCLYLGCETWREITN